MMIYHVLPYSNSVVLADRYNFVEKRVVDHFDNQVSVCPRNERVNSVLQI